MHPDPSSVKKPQMLWQVTRWHIKSGMCGKGHILAMRQRGGVAGLQMFEKTTGKNLLHINSNVQHNRAGEGSEWGRDMHRNVYQQ